MIKINYDNEKKDYTVSECGIVIESFATLFEALDYRAALIFERDHAFNDYGSEFDLEEY